MSEHGPDNWWSAAPPPSAAPDGTPPPADPGYSSAPVGPPPAGYPGYPPPYGQGWGAPEQHEQLLGAAEAMRDAAEMMRDASTPTATPERRWDFSWFTNWVKYHPHGKAFKVAVFTSAPGFALLLFTYHRQTGNGTGGMVAILVMLAALFYLVTRNAFSRWLMWGAVLSPLCYPPALISLLLGTAGLLFGWK